MILLASRPGRCIVFCGHGEAAYELGLLPSQHDAGVVASRFAEAARMIENRNLGQQAVAQPVGQVAAASRNTAADGASTGRPYPRSTAANCTEYWHQNA